MNKLQAIQMHSQDQVAVHFQPKAIIQYKTFSLIT